MGVVIINLAEAILVGAIWKTWGAIIVNYVKFLAAKLRTLSYSYGYRMIVANSNLSKSLGVFLGNQFL